MEISSRFFFARDIRMNGLSAHLSPFIIMSTMIKGVDVCRE